LVDIRVFLSILIPDFPKIPKVGIAKRIFLARAFYFCNTTLLQREDTMRKKESPRELHAPYYTTGEISTLVGVNGSTVMLYAKKAKCWIDTDQRPMLIRNDEKLAAAVGKLLDDIERNCVERA